MSKRGLALILHKPYRIAYVHKGKPGRTTPYKTLAGLHRYGMRNVPTNARAIRIVRESI